MRKLFFAVFVLLLSSSVMFGATKADINPNLSADGRYVTFERHYSNSKNTEIVVIDTKSMASKTVAGPVFDLAWKDKTTFAAAGANYVSVLKPNGQVLHSAWRTGAGFRAVPREWESVGSLVWKDKGVAFTAVEEGGGERAWYLDALSGKVDALSDVNPTPLQYRKKASYKNESIEVSSSGGLIRRSPGTDTLIRLGSAITPVLSPTGNELVVVDNIGQRSIRTIAESKTNFIWKNIFILHKDGYSLRPLTKNGGSQPAFSPDGKGIAYVTTSGDIGWASIDGSKSGTIVKSPDSVNQLRWHSDGKWLLVQSVEKGQASWKMIDPPSRRVKSFGVPLDIPNPGFVFLSPTGRMAVVLRQGSQSGEVDIVTKRNVRTIQFDFPKEQHLGFAPSASWATDEKYVAVSVGGGISIIDVDEGSVDSITGRLY